MYREQKPKEGKKELDARQRDIRKQNNIPLKSKYRVDGRGNVEIGGFKYKAVALSSVGYVDKTSNWVLFDGNLNFVGLIQIEHATNIRSVELEPFTERLKLSGLTGIRADYYTNGKYKGMFSCVREMRKEKEKFKKTLQDLGFV